MPGRREKNYHVPKSFLSDFWLKIVHVQNLVNITESGTDLIQFMTTSSNYSAIYRDWEERKRNNLI